MQKGKSEQAIYVAHEDSPPFDPAAPEKNLLRAILMSALSDLRKSGETGKKAQEFFLDIDEDYVFSFRSICSYLNVDPDKILLVTGVNLEED